MITNEKRNKVHETEKNSGKSRSQFQRVKTKEIEKKSEVEEERVIAVNIN